MSVTFVAKINLLAFLKFTCAWLIPIIVEVISDYLYLCCFLFSLQQLYLNTFKDCGYDNVSFIAGMTDKVGIALVIIVIEF